MRAATVAHDFRARHAVAAVNLFRDALDANRFEEAGPSTPCIKLRVGTEQRVTARRAFVHAFSSRIVIFASKRSLGATLAQHAVLLRRQFRAPFFIGLRHLLSHYYSLSTTAPRLNGIVSRQLRAFPIFVKGTQARTQFGSLFFRDIARAQIN